MSDTFCNYVGKRDEVIVSYLYGEMDGDERAAFDRHVLACAPCRAELADLREVRSELAHWSPPELARQIPWNLTMPVPISPPATVHELKRSRSFAAIPVWAQAIAATLLLGVAAGIANLDITYSRAAGLSVRTGWRHESAPPAVPPAATLTSSTTNPAPWRGDLVALEQDLRAAIEARPAAATAPASAGNDEMLRRVRQLIQDSERQQESELALKVAEVARELQMQRQADLVKIDRTLGVMQSRTGIEVMRTQRQVNSLAQQVSQRP